MELFGTRQPQFIHEPAQHAGRYLGEVPSGLKCWEIRDPREAPFDIILSQVGEVIHVCRRSLPNSAHFFFDAYLRGRTLCSSCVYIMVAGSEKRYRRKIIKKNKQVLRTYPGLKMSEWQWPPLAPGIQMAALEGGPEEVLLYSCSDFDLLTSVHKDSDGSLSPLNKSLIIIKAKSNPDGVHRAGVLSGIVTLGPRPDLTEFFLAPSHLFMPRQSTPLEAQAGEGQLDSAEGSDSDISADSDEESSILRAASATPADTRPDSPASKDLESTPEKAAETAEAETARLVQEIDEEYIEPVTDPSITYLHACKTFSVDNDYVLIPLPEEWNQGQQDLRHISPIVTQYIQTGEYQISVTTPSRGLIHGRMEGRPTFMRLPYATKCTKAYPIHFEVPIAVGDSGSVVTDQHTGYIYGFIVALSVDSKIGYVISASTMLQDITARPGLPLIDSNSSTLQPSKINDLNESEDLTHQPLTSFQSNSPTTVTSRAKANENLEPRTTSSTLHPTLQELPSGTIIQGNSGDLKRQRSKEDSADEASPKRPTLRIHHPWLACPFAKLNPIANQNCYQRKLRRIQDVKLHLKRHHQSIRCPRCLEVFPNEADMNNHRQSPVACEVRREGRLDQSMTIPQIERLKKKVPNQLSVEEQWFTIFDWLFPGQPRPYSAFLDAGITPEINQFSDFMHAKGSESIVNRIKELGFGPLDEDEDNTVSSVSASGIRDALADITRQWRSSSSEFTDVPSSRTFTLMAGPPSFANLKDDTVPDSPGLSRVPSLTEGGNSVSGSSIRELRSSELQTGVAKSITSGLAIGLTGTKSPESAGDGVIIYNDYEGEL